MAPLAAKLVLVVDDDLAVRTLVTKALLATGYEVKQAANGLEASDLLGSMGRLPDLLICDVMMPIVDGFSLARLLKAHAALREIPIIFMTARTQLDQVLEGINLGARHYVQKPFKVTDLLEKVEKTLR